MSSSSGGSMGGIIAALLLVIFILIAVFIITRAFWLWYWKISKRVSELEDINASLEEIKAILITQTGISSKTVNRSDSDKLPDL